MNENIYVNFVKVCVNMTMGISFHDVLDTLFVRFLSRNEPTDFAYDTTAINIDIKRTCFHHCDVQYGNLSSSLDGVYRVGHRFQHHSQSLGRSDPGSMASTEVL